MASRVAVCFYYLAVSTIIESRYLPPELCSAGGVVHQGKVERPLADLDRGPIARARGGAEKSCRARGGVGGGAMG